MYSIRESWRALEILVRSRPDAKKNEANVFTKKRAVRYTGIMDNQTTRVTNDFAPVFDARSKILILGSMPSVASRKAGFYYMNPHNRFWKVLEAIVGEPFPALAKEEKIRALKRHRIALYDVVGDCEIQASSDATIKNVRSSDISSILEKTKIEKILLNGQKAYALFVKFHPELSPMARPMPSTSPANAKLSLEKLVEVWGKEFESFESAQEKKPL